MRCNNAFARLLILVFRLNMKMFPSKSSLVKMSQKRAYPDSPMSSGTPPKRARKVLTLADKVKVIEAVQSGMSNRTAAEKFSVGRTQINTIVLNQEAILRTYSEGANAKAKYLSPKPLKYKEIDAEVWKFFLNCREKRIPVNGPILQRHAQIVATRLSLPDFSASNGWLESFIDRHQLKMANLHGESADVNPETCDQWLERLPELLDSYALEDIYNCDKTSIWFRTVPTKSLIHSTENASGVKLLKDRFTVLLTASATGKKEKMWVIGKSKKPRSFPKYESDYSTAFTYKSNKRGWMTSDIFQEYINWLNNKMKIQGRKILLLLDNCPAHPPLAVSNVKLLFLPKNTTAKLQPLDQGIIAWLKQRYKKLLLTHICEAMEECNDVTSLAKAVRIYDAIVNTKQAWDSLPIETIEKCFRRCGVTKDTNTPPSTPVEPPSEPDDFAIQFEKLLEVPWDEYLAYDSELEADEPCTAPTEELESNDDHAVIDDMLAEPEPEENFTSEMAITQLKKLQKFCLHDQANFDLVNQLLSRIRMNAIKEQLNRKSKQTSILNFIQNP